MKQNKKITKLLLKESCCDNCEYIKGRFAISSVDNTVSLLKDSDKYCQKRKTKPANDVCVQWKFFDDSIANLYKIVRLGFPSLIAKEIAKVQPIAKSTGQTFFNWRLKDEKQI